MRRRKKGRAEPRSACSRAGAVFSRGVTLAPIIGAERILACRTEEDWLKLFDELEAEGLVPGGDLASAEGRQAAAAFGAKLVNRLPALRGGHDGT